jgi:hypothetical protein
MEMMVSLALGAVVLSAAGQIYIKSVSATWTVAQRAEMQQDFRAASNMLMTDLSMAGAGLGSVSISLPSGTTPQYGCDQTGVCHIDGVAGTYPTTSGTPHLYGLIPGYTKGPIVNAINPPIHTDVITVVYTDSSFYLNCYIPKVTAKGVVTFSPPTSPATWATEACLPNSNVAAPQAVNDTAAGLTPGDVVMMTLGGTTVVAEVTGAVTTAVVGGNTTYIVPFANFDASHDPLKLNQTPSGGGLNSAPLNAAGSASAAPCGGTGPCRLLVITYYIDTTTTPYLLMRQISGHVPMPVVENIAYLKFSYDLFNSSTGSPAVNQPNPGSGDANDTASNGLLPNQITKINILNMAMDSTQRGTQFGAAGYQRMDLQTSVSPRNLTFTNNYNN